MINWLVEKNVWKKIIFIMLYELEQNNELFVLFYVKWL